VHFALRSIGLFGFLSCKGCREEQACTDTTPFKSQPWVAFISHISSSEAGKTEDGLPQNDQ